VNNDPMAQFIHSKIYVAPLEDNYSEAQLQCGQKGRFSNDLDMY